MHPSLYVFGWLGTLSAIEILSVTDNYNDSLTIKAQVHEASCQSRYGCVPVLG